MRLALYRVTLRQHRHTGRVRVLTILAAPGADPVAFGLQVSHLPKDGEGIANIDILKEIDLTQTPMLLLDGPDETPFWRRYILPGDGR